jgi:cobalt-zinc-cadmium efflux system membrane fusion protein
VRFTVKILIMIAVSILFLGCGKKEQPEVGTQTETGEQNIVKLSSQSIKEISLQTEIVSLKSFSREISIPARILANQDNEAQVGTLVQGRVSKVFVKVGDHVKAGQDLMLVEGLEIGEIKEQYLTARANLGFQKANFERQKKLLEENIGSQKPFLKRKMNMRNHLQNLPQMKTGSRRSIWMKMMSLMKKRNLRKMERPFVHFQSNPRSTEL